MHLYDVGDCCKGSIGHFKNQNGLQMADLIQPPANRCFLYFNSEHKHIGVLFICGVGVGF